MKLESKPGKGNKIHISVDGEYATTVDADFWYSCGYSDGEDLDDDDLAEFLYETDTRRAYNKAVGLLAVRDHGRVELIRKLAAFFGRDIAESAADLLTEQGFIDDEAYAQKLAESLFRRKKYAPERIRRELTLRGIDRETAEYAVSMLEADERESIESLLETKFVNSLSDEKGVRRTFNALIRMGYDFVDVRNVIRNYIED
ncbi:MAG: recombination regulator RecX [Oscillospiraceae bacterium]|nr:recombination regulator RecX [Oscillospiraceae bacterium]